MKGKGRRMHLGSLIKHITQSVGKPRTRPGLIIYHPDKGEGLDGSTQSAKETGTGQSWTGSMQANLTAGNSKQGQNQQAPSISRSVPVSKCHVSAVLLAPFEQKGRKWGG